MNTYPSTGALLAEEQLAGRLRLDLEGLTTNSEPLTPVASRAAGARLRRATDGLLRDHRGPLRSRVRDGLDAPVRRHVHRRERGRGRATPFPPGEVGSRLLVTNLFNRVQPLIRFEIADLVSAGSRTVPLRAGAHAPAVTRGPRRGRAPPARRGRSPAPVRARDRGPGRARVPGGAGGRFASPAGGAPRRRRRAHRSGSGRGSAPVSAELGVPEPSVEVERVDALERTPGGKLQLVVAAR